MAKHVAFKHWPEKVKIETVTTYLALGNAPMTAAVTGVSAGVIRQWKLTDWWKDLEEQIRNEQDGELDVKLSKIIDKSLDTVMDRIEHGDFMYDSKSGKFHRKPVHMRDALRATTEILDKRNLLRGKPTSRIEKTNTQDSLAKLADEFAKFAKARTIEGEVIGNKSTREEGYEETRESGVTLQGEVGTIVDESGERGQSALESKEEGQVIA